jgi:hypothetical protein
MTTDTSEKGLESLIMRHMADTDDLADGIDSEDEDVVA